MINNGHLEQKQFPPPHKQNQQNQHQNPQQTTPNINNNNVLTIKKVLHSLNLDSKQPDGSPTDDIDANMEEFLRIPYCLELFLWNGMLLCLDSFLHVLTVIPLKFVWSFICLVLHPLDIILGFVRWGGGGGGKKMKQGGYFRFHRRLVFLFV